MSQAQIHERGYLRYVGARMQTGNAVVALLRHSLQEVLGIRRSLIAKILPGLMALFAFAPPVVFVGVSVFLPEEIGDFIPTPTDLLGMTRLFVWAVLILGAPVAMCPDRRHGTLALYLASPLDRDRYLVAKYAALAIFHSIVVVGPQLFLVLGVPIARNSIGWGTAAGLGRVLLTGVVITLMYTSVAVALASLTDRRGAASALIGLWLLMSRAVVGIIAELGAKAVVLTADVTTASTLVSTVIAGGRTQPDDFGAFDDPYAAVATWVVWLTAGAWIVLPALFARWRYQRIEVTR